MFFLVFLVPPSQIAAVACILNHAEGFVTLRLVTKHSVKKFSWLLVHVQMV